MFGKELFKRLSVCVCSFCFGFENGMCDLTVLIPDHCLSMYLAVFVVVWLYVSLKL